MPIIQLNEWQNTVTRLWSAEALLIGNKRGGNKRVAVALLLNFRIDVEEKQQRSSEIPELVPTQLEPRHT